MGLLEIKRKRLRRKVMNSDKTRLWYNVWNRVLHVRIKNYEKDFKGKSVEAPLGFVLCEEIEKLQEQIDELKKTWWTKFKQKFRKRKRINITTLDSGKKVWRMKP